MSSQLVPLDLAGGAAALPAHLQAFASEGNEFGFSGPGYPTISIKGKVFTIVRDKEKTLVTKPGSDDEPASSLEVVILNAGPKKGFAKTWYAEGFQEGSAQPPDCYSIDGVSPDERAENKQALKCKLCPQHAVGSGATNQNPKARACKSSKLLAVAPAGSLNDPMLLRVPGGSTIPLSEYGEFLAKRGIKAAAVVTRISFDYSVAHPALTFKPVGGITAEMAAEVFPMIGSELVMRIIGEKSVDEAEQPKAITTATPPVNPPVTTATPPVTPAAVPVNGPAPGNKTSFAGFSVAGDSAAPVGQPTETKPPKRTATKKTTPVATSAETPGLDTALDSLSFDD